MRGIRSLGVAVAALVTAALTPVTSAVAATQDGDYTSLRFYDSSGALLFKGEVRTFTPDTGTMTSHSYGPDDASVQWKKGFTDYWGVAFGAGTGNTLAAGDYVDATPQSTVDNTQPHVTFGGNGHSCDGKGKFTIHQIEFAPDGTLAKLAATFEGCGDDAPTVFGSVAYHADQPAPAVPHGPPDPPTDIRAAGGVGSLTLQWTNPTQSFADLVIRRVGGTVPPTSPTDGDLIYTGSGQSVRVDGVGPNTRQTFAFWTRNAEGVFGARAYLTTTGSYLFDAQARMRDVEFGQSTLVEAMLRDTDTYAQVGRTVQLWSRSPGTAAWAAVTSAKTDSQGYVGFRVAPARSTEYRLTFAGAENITGTDSGPLPVVSVPLMTIKAPTTARVGQVYVVTVAMKPIAPGTKIELLEFKKRKGYLPVATAKVNKKGVATFKVTRTKRATYSYSGHLPPSRNFGEAWSGRTTTVKVK